MSVPSFVVTPSLIGGHDVVYVSPHHALDICFYKTA